MLALAACDAPPEAPSTPAPVVAPAPPPSEAPAPPPPLAPQPVARVVGDELVLRATSAGGRAAESRVPLPESAEVVLVDLDVRGDRGVWIVRPDGTGQLSRIVPGPALEPFTSGPLWSPGALGSRPSLRLADLDGDGRYDAPVCTTRATDIGPERRCTALRRTDAGFQHDDSLRRAVARRESGPERALRDARVGANVVARASLGVVRLTPIPAGFDASVSATAGADLAVLSTATEPGGEADRFPLALSIVRLEPEPALLATADAGELHEAFTDDACRHRFRLGAPMVRVADASPEGRARALVVTRTEGARRVARVFTWDGTALAPRGEWIEVDRCDTGARDVRVRLTDTGPQLEIEPLPEGTAALF